MKFGVGQVVYNLKTMHQVMITRIEESVFTFFDGVVVGYEADADEWPEVLSLGVYLVNEDADQYGHAVWWKNYHKQGDVVVCPDNGRNVLVTGPADRHAYRFAGTLIDCGTSIEKLGGHTDTWTAGCWVTKPETDKQELFTGAIVKHTYGNLHILVLGSGQEDRYYSGMVIYKGDGYTPVGRISEEWDRDYVGEIVKPENFFDFINPPKKCKPTPATDEEFNDDEEDIFKPGIVVTRRPKHFPLRTIVVTGPGIIDGHFAGVWLEEGEYKTGWLKKGCTLKDKRLSDIDFTPGVKVQYGNAYTVVVVKDRGKANFDGVIIDAVAGALFPVGYYATRLKKDLAKPKTESDESDY